MRSKSPELMSEIKKYIEDYYLQNRQSPSTTKIAEAVGIARGTAYKYLVEMAEKNMIEYDGQEISTNVTRKYSGEQTQTPIVGSIPCGSPQYEEENIEEYVSLPTAIFGKGDFFILRASGQSMIDAGIDDGDLVVVKKQVEANDGDIVVALVDNQNTLKRYFRDDENKKIILHPENKKMKDIIVDECCMDDMNRSENSVTKYLNELEDADLIETVQRGQGRTNIIYVKNFELVEEEAAEVRSSNIESLEVQKSDFKKCEKQTSRSSKNEPLEVQKTDTNNTKENYININNTDPILSITEEKDDAIDGMEEYQAYSEIIKENIEYDALLQRNPYEKDAIQGIFDLILETVISNKASMTISGQEYPMNLVKSKFLKLNSSHIEYVLGCLGKNTTKVYNIKSYLLASLFNAVSTMNSYYKAEVNHDMPQFAW